MTAHCKGMQSFVTVINDPEETLLAEGDVVWVPHRHVTPDHDHKIVQTKDGRIRLMRMLCPTSCHFYQVCVGDDG